jgi:hypothetical protein
MIDLGSVCVSADHSSARHAPVICAGLCPKGDDPLTTNQNTREVLLGWDSLAGDLGGFVSFSLLGHRVSLPANARQLTEER